MVLVQKMAIFSTFFLGNIGQENVLYDILEGKNAFLGYKNRSSNSRKIDIFPKGLTHGCGVIMAIFFNFFFSCNIGQENVFYDILERKNVFFFLSNRNLFFFDNN